jgi:hypothetical protein
MITLQFSTTDTWASQLIRWATWSPYSHVDLVLPGGWLLGATPDSGVSIRPPVSATGSKRFQVDAPDAVFEAALSQRDRPYDWAGIFGWGLRRDWQDQDAWFCSEFIAWCFEQAGCPLLRAQDLWRITPRDLLLSPRLRAMGEGGDRGGVGAPLGPQPTVG